MYVGLVRTRTICRSRGSAGACFTRKRIDSKGASSTASMTWMEEAQVHGAALNQALVGSILLLGRARIGQRKWCMKRQTTALG